MKSSVLEQVNRIPIESPLPGLATRAFGFGYDRLLPHFYVGHENVAVRELFRREYIRRLPTYSPIYFYGSHGVGKSALAFSLQLLWERDQSPSKPVQISASDFARQLVGAISADDMPHFRNRIRTATSLLIDSLEGMLNKYTAQDELMHVMDELQERQCPILVTAVDLPQTLRGLRKALSSRLTGGNSLLLLPPGKQAIRQAMSELFLSQHQKGFSAALLDRFLEKLPANLAMPTVRGMLMEYLNATSPHDAALESMKALEVNSEKEDTRPHASIESDLLERIIRQRDPAANLKPQQIAKAIAKHSGCSLVDLRGATRKSQVVRARSLAMYLCRSLLPMSLEMIGAYFGGRDHTTVMHAVRKIETQTKTDVLLIRLQNDVLRELSQTNKSSSSAV